MNLIHGFSSKRILEGGLGSVGSYFPFTNVSGRINSGLWTS
jgi:hypothetical protein